jgi:NADP-dependent 3-hydroxy acid dehydrogenase YdfG
MTISDQPANRLKDVTIVVTGAGRGLGAAIAISLADLGGNLILCARTAEALDVTAGHIEARTGLRAQKVLLDLAEPASVEAAAAEITRGNATIDVLINNGAMWLERRDTPYSAAEVTGAIGSAVTGTFLLTQALLPAMQASKRPDVVTIGSVSGLLNVGLHNVSVPFYVAKHGQAALADGLRQVLVGTPVRSICIHPPWLDDISPLDADWELSAARSKDHEATNRDIVEAVIFAITRPRNITIASMIIDSDYHGVYESTHASTS